MNIDLDALQALAEKATPGPWRATEYRVIAGETEDRLGFDLNTKSANGNRDDCRRLAKFIAAANPQTILALIAMIRRADTGKPYGYAVEQPNGHVTFFKDDPTAFRKGKWAAMGVVVHNLFSGAKPADTGAEAWQPISTAPKDGTPILVGAAVDGHIYEVDHGYFEVLTEDEDDGPWDIRGGEPWCSYEGRAAGTYFCVWLPGQELETRWQVTETFPYTHWKSAPPAPSTAQPKEQQG